MDILETPLFGNKIDRVYQTKERNLHSKDIKQTPVYLRAIHKYLVENNIYRRIANLIKSKKRNHSEAKVIDAEITRATQYREQKCKKRHIDFWDFDIHTIKMKSVFWCYLLAKKKRYLDTTEREMTCLTY